MKAREKLIWEAIRLVDQTQMTKKEEERLAEIKQKLGIKKLCEVADWKNGKYFIK